MHCISVMSFVRSSSENRKAKKGKSDEKDYCSIYDYALTASYKRLFAEGTMPAAFSLQEAKTSPSGVIVATFKRAGEVETRSF